MNKKILYLLFSTLFLTICQNTVFTASQKEEASSQSKRGTMRFFYCNKSKKIFGFYDNQPNTCTLCKNKEVLTKDIAHVSYDSNGFTLECVTCYTERKEKEEEEEAN